MRLLLNAHSNIAISEEINFFRYRMFSRSVEDWDREIPCDPKTKKELSDIFGFIAEDKGLPFIRSISTDNIFQAGASIKGIYEAIGSCILMENGKKRWGEKTPENILYCDILADMFPDAKFLIIRRDPRAVIASMNKVFFYPEDVSLNLLNYKFYEQHGYDLASRYIAKDRKMDLLYEDLTANPRTVLENIFSFIDEPFEEGVFDFHRSSGKFMSEYARTDFNKNALLPIKPDFQDQWQRQLTSAQVHLINAVLGIGDNVLPGSSHEIDTIMEDFSAKEAKWQKLRALHPSHRDFQYRNAGQAISSNIPELLMPHF